LTNRGSDFGDSDSSSSSGDGSPSITPGLTLMADMCHKMTFFVIILADVNILEAYEHCICFC